MQKLFIETTYDDCLLQGHCEVMSGGVRVSMTAPYPGLAEHLMLRRELTETDEQKLKEIKRQAAPLQTF